MARLIFVLCMGALCAACDGANRFPVAPAPVAVPAPNPAPPPEPAPVAQQITIGEVRGKFLGGVLHFDLTAPASGILEARLSWIVVDRLLRLVMEDRVFSGTPPHWSPVVGTMPVTAGRTYRIKIAEGGSDWWYDDPFVLTTSIK